MTALVPRSDVGEFRKRYKWLVLFVFGAFSIILGRLFQLQVLEGGEHAAIAHDNVVRRVALRTTRGVVRDATGKILASSRPSFNVYVVPGRVMPSARQQERRPRRDAIDTFPRIADTLRLNPEERAKLAARIRTACADDRERSPCWRPLLVREDVTRDIVAEIKQHQVELAGAEVVANAVRYYPQKSLGAHLLGYIAEIDADTLAKARPEGYERMAPAERAKANPLQYAPGDTLGATGVEKAWESYLRGQRGWEKRVVDARGRPRSGPDADRLLDEPHRQDALPGRDLRLTIDLELEQAVERAMRPHPSGAVVVIDVRTGRLLASLSKPDFDPNALSGGGGRARIRETFEKLTSNPLQPLLDKTISGAFQPGSTFKPFSALAALEGGLLDPEDKERCDGAFSFGRRLFRCTHVHGKVDMHGALAQSCNIYFYRLAETVGMDRIAKIATEFGLGEKTGLGVNPEAPGRIPTRSWYALHYHGQFRIGFTLNTAIGQGATTVTPTQLALAYAALANGGTLYVPQVVRAVETSDGTVVQDFPPRVRRQVAIRPEHISRVNDALHAVVNDMRGTAFPVRDAGLDVSGKTGTAQTGYVPREGEDPKTTWLQSRDHAWFAAFSPSRTPEVAVVVLIERGGSGPTQAAPVAMEIVREYNRIRAGRPESAAPRSSPAVTGAPRSSTSRTSVPPAPPANTPPADEPAIEDDGTDLSVPPEEDNAP